MPRSFSFCLAVVVALPCLTTQAMARPHFLPRIGLPKINLGKGVGAVTYPVTKSLVNGGKTVFKTAAAAETLGVLPAIGPSGVNTIARKVIVEVSKH